jgi:hypothetical protein
VKTFFALLSNFPSPRAGFFPLNPTKQTSAGGGKIVCTELKNFEWKNLQNQSSSKRRKYSSHSRFPSIHRHRCESTNGTAG